MGRSKQRKELITKQDEAAGGLVVRRSDDVLSVALIGVARDRTVRWSLPKGHFKRLETPEQAAVREVQEETGLVVKVVEPLEVIDYWFVEHKVRYHKFVHYFLMRAIGGSFDDHDDEVVDVRWFPWDAALETMAYTNERGVLETHRDLISRLVP